MDKHCCLATESAENAVPDFGEQVKQLTSRLKLRSFYAQTPFGKKDEKRPCGRYFTFEFSENVLENNALCEEISQCLSREMKEVIKRDFHKECNSVLVAGLGNPKMVADALGSEVCARLETGEKGKKRLGAVMPSVYGVTGVESLDVVCGVASRLAPDVIIVVDTLATRRVERMYHALQLSTAGIVPGAGVSNARKEMSVDTLGFPTLSIGMPLVAHTAVCGSLPAGYVVTPKEIDLLVPVCAEIIASAINRFCTA